LAAVSFSPYLLVQRARVGTTALRHQDARQLLGEPALAIASALAPPRLWGHLLDVTLDAFVEGYARPHDGKISTRAHQGLRVAQGALRERIDGMIDRRRADVALLALACEGHVLHLLAAGALHAYVLRQGKLRRLGARDAPGDGVLKADPVWCVEPVEPGDLVLAGPSTVFTEVALQRLREAWLANRQLDPRDATTALVSEPLGPGVALAAFRVA
jgi:hypothetical protein